MTTLVIDRKALPESLMSFICSPRVLVSAESDKVVLTPAAEDAEDEEPYIDGPDSRYIDPDDYPDTTAYLNALPGVAERIIKSMNAPDSEFEEWNWREELGWDEEKGIFTKVPDPNA